MEKANARSFAGYIVTILSRWAWLGLLCTFLSARHRAQLVLCSGDHDSAVCMHRS